MAWILFSGLVIICVKPCTAFVARKTDFLIAIILLWFVYRHIVYILLRVVTKPIKNTAAL